MNDPKSFDLLYKGALSADTSGWDFSFLRNRKSTEDLPWDYKKIVAGYLKNTNSLLDMGTGGGELLSTLTPLPAKVCATEGYEPNYSIAKDKLGNMGVEVFFVKDHNKLAFKDNSFGLIINRHEDFEPGELRRILIDGGIFVTQQVGGKNNININRFLNDKSLDNNNYNLDNTINILK
jgi:ubiquinone/menaquinone biosynthesis C-methylase UbiE